MLSSGTAASRRSASVCSAGVVRAVTTVIVSSVSGRAEDGVRIEVGVATDEAAGHLRKRAGVDDQAEAFAWGVGNRDEDGVGLGAREDALNLSGPPEHGDSLQSSPRQLRIVVHEADHLFPCRLPQFAQEAAAPAAGTDDKRPMTVAASWERGDSANERALPEA